MAFNPAVITSISVVRDDAELLISWTSTAPLGTWYQVYVARKLVYKGQALRCKVPYPGGARPTIDIGSVLPTDLLTNFSSTLPAVAGNGDRATLTWQGGTYQDATNKADIRNFHIFASAVAGGPVVLTAPVAIVAAYAQNIILDGFGLGEFGLGGFGEAESDYTWQSGPLTRGVWQFTVKTADKEGNLSAGSTVSCTISTAPRPPAPNAQGLRLTRTYNATTHVATLNWLASPG